MSLTVVPYNRVEISRNILFATRGGKIHSFSLSNNRHISTWQHPEAEKFATPLKTDARRTQNETEEPLAVEPGEPPAKKQKTEQGADRVDIPAGQPEKTKAEEFSRNADNNGKKKVKRHSKGLSHSEKSRMGRVVDRPLITLMTCTDDGQHLVAVSGHDKAVWVFEHDGQGHLTQLSQRVMPKRPSSISLGYNSQIIVADKFGDVYSIPLLMTALSPSALAFRTAATPSMTGPKFTEPAANTFTVHSKRNLAALENQRKQLEAKKTQDEALEEDPGFEITLLLGHVSMLTSLIVAQSQGRKYILTADRDEHIRVSRYIPQAHITEAYCLGHREFISNIMIPRGHEDILISGGGDEDLFIWDWKAGSVLSRTNLLALAQEISPQTTKVAVSGLTSLLYPYDGGHLTYVLATCEDLKAIFAWQLFEEAQLKNPSVIQLPCNPLHIAISNPSDGSPLKLIVAMDSGQNIEARSLHAYTLTRSEGRLLSDEELPLHGQTMDDAEMQVFQRDIRDMFYTVENLRKQQGGEDGTDGGSEAVAVADHEAPPRSAAEEE